MNGQHIASRRYRRAVWRAFVLGFAVWGAAAGSIAWAYDIPVFDGIDLIGSITVNPDDSGVIGKFTSSEGAPPSLNGAAQFIGAHHFNWCQVINSDSDAPNDVHGVKQVPPYVDPPLGGYGNPDVHWADGLLWLWDEGADAPPGTPGFDDGYILMDVLNDFNPGSGPDKLLWFEDFPGGAPNSFVNFATWLVSVNADGSLHGFHEGFAWEWSNPGGGNGSSMVLPVTTSPYDGLNRYVQLGLPTFAADFNRTANVDEFDLPIWTIGFSQPTNVFGFDGDADDDDDVDGADFLTWQRQLGARITAGGNATGVPEPGGLLMLGLVGMAAMIVVRCARSN